MTAGSTVTTIAAICASASNSGCAAISLDTSTYCEAAAGGKGNPATTTTVTTIAAQSTGSAAAAIATIAGIATTAAVLPG